MLIKSFHYICKENAAFSIKSSLFLHYFPLFFPLFTIAKKKEYIKIDRDKSTFKSHRDFDSEIEMTFKHF